MDTFGFTCSAASGPDRSVSSRGLGSRNARAVVDNQLRAVVPFLVMSPEQVPRGYAGPPCVCASGVFRLATLSLDGIIRPCYP